MKLTLKTKKENGRVLIETILLKNKNLNNYDSNLIDTLFDLTGKEIRDLKPIIGSKKTKKYTNLNNGLEIQFKRKKKHKIKLKGSLDDITLFIESLIEKTFEENIYDMLLELVSLKTGKSKKELSSIIVLNNELNEILNNVGTISINEDFIDQGVMTIDFIDLKEKGLSEKNSSSRIIITQSLGDFITKDEPLLLTNKEILQKIKDYHTKKQLMIKSFNKKQKDSILTEK